MNTDSDGALDIQIPRYGVDSLDENGFDEDFIVLIYTSGESYPIQTEYTEIETNAESRSVYIPIKDGDYKIQIIGTHVVPEFGTIAAIILAVAITSIIVLSAKTRLSIMPKL
jgi:predicted secreted protein with PEFG-CTERM motif